MVHHHRNEIDTVLRKSGMTNRNLHERLDLGGLLDPDREKVVPGLEGHDPKEQTNDEAEKGVHDDEVTRHLQPAAGRCAECRDSQEESNEDEDGIDYPCRQRKFLV